MGEILRCKERKLFQDAIQRCLDISGGLRLQIVGVAGVIGLPLGEAVGPAHGWGHRLPDPEALRQEPSYFGFLAYEHPFLLCGAGEATGFARC
jgi:hypothetical protein